MSIYTSKIITRIVFLVNPLDSKGNKQPWAASMNSDAAHALLFIETLYLSGLRAHA